MGVDNLSIEKSTELNLNYPSVSERYFSHYYFVPKNPKKKTFVKPKNSVASCKSSLNADNDIDKRKNENETEFHHRGEDTCVMIHSNRICIVSLPPYHPVIRDRKNITKVDFCVDGFDRLSNKVSGKGKRGAQIVGLFSPLCKVHCDDNSSYTILAGIRGKLIEVNERLLQNPHMIVEAPNAEGYLAVVLPKLNKSQEFKDFLLPKEEYVEIYSEGIPE